MFFTKNKPTPQPLLANISIIGVSAQAFFLADILQTSGYDVTIIVPPHLLEKYSQKGAFCIKSNRFQTKHANFHFASQVQNPCNFCFIASLPGMAKADLLLLDSQNLQAVPLINLSSLYNQPVMDQLGSISSIKAFSNCQLSFGKNTIELLDSSPKIDLMSPPEYVEPIKNLFSDSIVDIRIIAPNKNFLWQRLAPYFIANLLVINYRKSISALLLQKEIRQQVDRALDEIASLAKSDKISLNTSDILAQIYTFADNYQGDITTSGDFNAFSHLISGINPFDTPALFNMLNLAANKY